MIVAAATAGIMENVFVLKGEGVLRREREVRTLVSQEDVVVVLNQEKR